MRYSRVFPHYLDQESKNFRKSQIVWLDQWVAACLVPLAVWILLSGLDDLFIDLVFFLTGREQFPWPAESELDQAPQRRIAILVPLWREYRVIGRMIEHNLSVIRYENYDIFIGVYPNDQLTARVVAETERRHPRVHLALCPHEGPTSKGDCLNWIYHQMTDHEARHGVRFDVVVTHDAEDLIHPESLRLINWFSRSYDMVQIPVLPLPTGLGEFTHGLYCDEFAEYQLKDIPARQRLRGFLPSNGVGTGFGRAALERLGEVHGGLIFDPESLTEDYDNGYWLHVLGYRQVFVPIRLDAALPAATREYFPRNFRSAVRQRSRWVAGIALQGWQRHGWRPWRQIYWAWRDRKGLVGNLLSPAANLFLLYGISSYLLTARPGQSWHLGGYVPLWVTRIYAITCGISLLQVVVRAHCCARIYGCRFAAAAPLRMFWGNLLNCAATVAALRQFVAARIEHRSLAWHKTEHAYPAHRIPEVGRPRLGEVLIGMNRVSTGQLARALREVPEGLRIGEYLLQLQQISEEHLYQALSFQTGIPLGLPGNAEVDRLATRVLPAAAALRWKVMQYRVDAGQLHLVTADVPSEAMVRELNRLSELELRFHLIRPNEFEDLAREYLSAPPSASHPADRNFRLDSLETRPIH
jgi:adsorption protein B